MGKLLELGKNQGRAGKSASPEMPKKGADGAGGRLNLPQPRAGNRPGDVQDGKPSRTGIGSETAREQAGLSIL